MLNRFKIALHGTSATNDDSSIGIAYTFRDSKFDKRGSGPLTRSSSFREELHSGVAKNRIRNGNNNDASTNQTWLQRGRSQVLHRTTITEEVEADESNMTNSANHRQFLKRSQSVTIDSNRSGQKVAKFRYTRPEFLQLRTDDEISVSADHEIRPIILPRDATRLPWLSGYAECINAGKSIKNEDQAVCYQDVIVGMNSRSDNIKGQIPFTLFGLYDGHAGNAVAVAAANQLHHIISEKLRLVADLLISLEFGSGDRSCTNDDEDFEDCVSSPTTHEKQSSVQSDSQSITSVELQSTQEAPSDLDGTSEKQVNIPSTGESTEAPSETDSKGPLDQSKSAGVGNETTSRIPQSISSRPSKTVPNDDHPECDRIETALLESSSNAIERTALIGSNSLTASESFSASLGFEDVILMTSSNVTVETLVKGALESSFWEMDEIIGRDKDFYKMPGGCAAIVSIFILGKLYVCNAGDSRAIVCKSKQVIPMSFDFTPISERERILRLGQQRPELMGNDFTHLEFIRRPTRRDLGKQMLYRDAYMTGWSLKEITYDDLKIPLVWGEGKRSRLCACIGLSRGFGDHELRAQYGSLLIKPFLTPEPEVRVLNLEEASELTNEDVLIQASDGLWDVATNEEISELVESSLSIDNEVARSKYRYISVAQDLVGWSRGWNTKTRAWRMSNGRFASMDDISVFVVPLKQYRDEYLEWKRLRNEATLPNTRTAFRTCDKE